MALNDLQFHDAIDALQRALEDRLDASGLDVDLENSGGVLTIGFSNGSQLIVSRQPALAQLWIAARSGGYHLDCRPEQGGWYCSSSGESLAALLARLVREQAGSTLDFSGLPGGGS